MTQNNALTQYNSLNNLVSMADYKTSFRLAGRECKIKIITEGNVHFLKHF